MNRPEARAIRNSLADWTAGWHADPHLEESLIASYQDFDALLYGLHLLNYRLWHEEDIARRQDVDDGVIADTKHTIDELNQARNDAVEEIDEYLCDALRGQGLNEPSLPLNSETCGSIIDRLSILSLKVYHMAEQTRRQDVDPRHIEMCQARLDILTEQVEDLTDSLAALLGDLFAGRKRLKVYRQFKMYNDPRLNPQMYDGREPR